ncbi:MAG: ThuA domain-containing protein [Verrucomicrobiota bacterium]|nr:ThuA domain-containing protein [Verrucomicrobiota bacterium]
MILRILTALLLTGAAVFAAPKRLLLIGQSPDGHPPGTHEFMAGVRVVNELLKPFAVDIRTTIFKADEPWPEGPALIDQSDGILLLVTQGGRWMQTDPARHAALKRLAERKGAIVALHWSVGAKEEQFIAGQLALLGGTRGGLQRKYKILENDVRLAERAHPILRGLADFRIKDEFYYRLDLVSPSPAFHPLLTTPIDGNEETIAWAWDRPDGGRSFGYVGLHFHVNWERLEYRRLVTQAILWSLDLPIPAAGVKAEVHPQTLALPHVSQTPGGKDIR